MATISIAASGLTTKSKTISTVHTTRLLAAHRKVYGQIITQPFVPAVPEVRDAQGNITTPAVAAIAEVKRDMTDQEIFDRLGDAWFASMIALTYSAELGTAQSAALETANASVTPIAFT